MNMRKQPLMSAVLVAGLLSALSACTGVNDGRESQLERETQEQVNEFQQDAGQLRDHVERGVKDVREQADQLGDEVGQNLRDGVRELQDQTDAIRDGVERGLNDGR
ncbi:TolA-binding protein [Deinobacterium chartae]|uniref:TolA-binding protein n=1 Tax=Deinobacterium chartae TaxID=521158 RepID=A0A841HYH9_9DEIO|nr:hypothetical protein [Deinobacterium chartae]MBB6098601.1 TolA-binding protein [Deinobacterium chartae]